MGALLKLALLVLLFATALAVQAPAWLLARAVHDQTAGAVELRDAAGTVWNGQAVPVLHGSGANGPDLYAGTLAWHLTGFDWRHTALRFDVLQTPGGARAAALAVAPDRIQLAGGLRVPAAVLASSRWTSG